MIDKIKFELLDFVESIDKKKLAKAKVLNDYSVLSDDTFSIEKTNDGFVVRKLNSSEVFNLDDDFKVTGFTIINLIDNMRGTYKEWNAGLLINHIRNGDYNQNKIIQKSGYYFIIDYISKIMFVAKDNIFRVCFNIPSIEIMKVYTRFSDIYIKVRYLGDNKCFNVKLERSLFV